MTNSTQNQPTTAQDTDIVVDPDAIARLKAMGKPGSGLFAKIADIFIKTTPTQMQAIQKALDEKDISTVKITAHSLKSSSANLGAMQLSNAFKEIEFLAKDEKFEDIRPLLANLEPKFQKVEAYLNEQLKSS